MTNSMDLKQQKKCYVLIIFTLAVFTLFIVSCDQGGQISKSSENELIEKVNAVQRQMMIQGNISEEEELAMSSLCALMSRDPHFDNYNPENRIEFKNVENGPVYNGCEGLSIKETKVCFEKRVSIFIKQEFDLNISNALGLSSPKKVAMFFVIDKNGKLSGLKIRDSEVTIQAELARVLKKMPKMKPGSQAGNNVPVLCSVLVTYGSELEVEVVYIPEGPVE